MTDFIKSRPYLALVLACVMASTRIHHFGVGHILPDASIAVFFLAGRYLAGWVWFAAFFALAAMLDQAAFMMGVSAWCFTPAYMALVPAYAAMFFAGRYTAGAMLSDTRGAAMLVLLLGGGVLVFFALSNLGFWAGSGYFAHMSLDDYASAVLQYLPMYLATAFGYVAVGLMVEELRAASATPLLR